MQTVRASLTRLKSLIDTELPDGQDVFGYAGVTKKSLKDAIDVSYSLTQLIDDYDPKFTFEIIAFKRYSSAAYQTLKKLLEGENELKKKQLDRFLTTFAALIEKTKLVHYVVKGEGFRSEVELGELKSEVEELQKLKTSLSTEISELKSAHKEGLESAKQLEIAWTTSSELADKITILSTKSVKESTGIEEAAAKVETWTEEISEAKTGFASTSEAIGALSRKFQSQSEELDKNLAASEKSRQNIESLEKSCVSLENRIKEILGDSNRVGMGASFKARKDDLKWPHFIWGGVFLMSLVGLLFFSFFNVLPELKSHNVQWLALLAKSLFTFPLIWSAWFAARQYGQLSKVREDYAFKEAMAMAFEGHRQATREIDQDLAISLLQCCIGNMASNPIRLLCGKGDHGSPAHEALDSISNQFSKLKRAKASISGVGELEIENESS